MNAMVPSPSFLPLNTKANSAPDSPPKREKSMWTAAFMNIAPSRYFGHQLPSSLASTEGARWVTAVV